MYKRMKFVPELIPLIQNGTKRSTWRLDDDKNLSRGDVVECVNSVTGKIFAIIKLTSVRLTTFANLTEEEKQEHERFQNEESMLEMYSRYYNKLITRDYPLKVIQFEELRKSVQFEDVEKYYKTWFEIGGER